MNSPITRTLIQAIKHIRQSGVAILLVEQNMEIARAIGDCCAVLTSGKFAWHGSMREATERNDAARVYFEGH
jgi:branched-chain amino acid transport system ATP-binding protein